MMRNGPSRTHARPLPPSETPDALYGHSERNTGRSELRSCERCGQRNAVIHYGDGLRCHSCSHRPGAAVLPHPKPATAPKTWGIPARG